LLAYARAALFQDCADLRTMEERLVQSERLATIGRFASQIAHEIRNQYVIGYTPTNLARDGSFRHVRVDVNVPDLTVRTRAGYYARR
jgi:Ca-activated chloride channel family protein